MPEPTIIYPPIPENINASFIKPSRQFNQQAYKMLFAIGLFFLTYILLFIAAISIAAALMALGYFVITLKVTFITLVFGLGIAASGVMLVYFLIKFLFKKSVPRDYSDMIKITQEDQPALFNFIKKLTRETKVAFPKHVYLSPEVNASVFFESNFWSMFFPAKKNLQIGLGLINALNQSEFKAVLAHEFGHFSQRSLKFGSYVYNLNKVIYNLLYENDGYVQAVESFANMHSFLRITAFINLNLIRGIQFILRKVYVLINKSHMGLSREMEFQADAIAASVSGSNQVVNLLRRMEIADSCYDSVLAYWNNKIQNKQRADNFYEHHQVLMQYFAKDYDLKLDSANLPVVNKNLAVLNNRQVSINNQWASHPTIHEREKALDSLSILTVTIEAPAWQLFTNAVELQCLTTNRMYEQVKEVATFETINHDAFETMIGTERKANRYNSYYKGYYDNRNINIAGLEPTKPAFVITTVHINNLFNDVNCNLSASIKGMEQDINLLTYAMSSEDVKTFDYKGIKYKMEQAHDVINLLKQEITHATDLLNNLDQEIYTLFYHLADDNARTTLKQQYTDLLAFQEIAAKDYVLHEQIVNEMNPVYQNMKLEDINTTLAAVYETEKTVKPRLGEIFADTGFDKYTTAEQRSALEKYVAEDYKYFVTRYSQTNLTIFNEAMDAYFSVISKRHFEIKNTLLNFQLTLLNQPII